MYTRLDFIRGKRRSLLYTWKGVETSGAAIPKGHEKIIRLVVCVCEGVEKEGRLWRSWYYGTHNSIGSSIVS